jgi:hypothetical protein
VLDRVGVVRANLLKKPLEVICRCHFPAPDAARNSGGAPHTGDARFPAMVIAMASRGPQGALSASLVVIFDVAMGAMNCIIGKRLLVATRGCLAACPCGAVHDCLVVGGVLGGDALRLPERGPKEVALTASPWALLTASGQRNWAAQVGLAMSLGLVVPSLPPVWRGLG